MKGEKTARRNDRFRARIAIGDLRVVDGFAGPCSRTSHEGTRPTRRFYSPVRWPGVPGKHFPATRAPTTPRCTELHNQKGVCSGRAFFYLRAMFKPTDLFD